MQRRRQLWDRIIALLSSDEIGNRLDGFLTLSRFNRVLFNDDNDASDAWDIRDEQDFWNAARVGLLDDEDAVRKHALHVLKRAVAPGVREDRRESQQDHEQRRAAHKKQQQVAVKSMTKREKWASQEQDMLLPSRGRHGRHDESVSRMCGWDAFVHLYETLNEFAVHLFEAIWRPQMEILHPSAGNDTSTSRGEGPDRVVSSGPSFEWLVVLWQRGFRHRNTAVQRLVLESFLSRDWSRSFTLCVPVDFVTTTLVEALDDPAHHRTFGVEGTLVTATTTKALSFFGTCAGSMSPSSSIQFIKTFLAVALSRVPTRPGLACLCDCAEVAAQAVVEEADNNAGDVVVEVVELGRGLLRVADEQFGRAYRLHVSSAIMRVLSVLAPARHCTVGSLSRLLGALPQDLAKGELFPVFSSYLIPPGDKDAPARMAAALVHALEEYYVSGGACHAKDIEAWQEDADRMVALWAHVGDNEYRTLVGFVRERLARVHSRPYAPAGSAQKTVLLACALAKHDGLSVRSSGVSDMLGACAEEVVGYAEKCMPVLWTGLAPVNHATRAAKSAGSFVPSSRLDFSTEAAATTSVLAVHVVALALATLNTNMEISTRIDPNGEGTCKKQCELFLWRLLESLHATLSTTPSTSSSTTTTTPHTSSSVLRDNAIAAAQLRIYTLQCTAVALEGCAKVTGAGGGGDDKARLTLLAETLMSEGMAASASVLPTRAERARFHEHGWRCLCILATAFPRETLSSHFKARMLEYAVNAVESAEESYMVPVLDVVTLLLTEADNAVPVDTISRLVRGAWSALVDAPKRRLSTVTSFLNTAMHPAVFGRGHDLHAGPDAPVRWLVERLFEMGMRSPRVMRMTALHLCQRLLDYPEVGVHYMAQLRAMTFHGALIVHEEREEGGGQPLATTLSPADNLDTGTGLPLLDRDPELMRIFINSDMSVRVTAAHFAVMLHEKAVAGDRAAAQLGQSWFRDLFGLVMSDKDLAKELVIKFGAQHRRKLRVWQMLCVLSRFVDAALMRDEVDVNLVTIIERGNLPSVRQYVELFASCVYSTHASYVDTRVATQLRRYDDKMQAVASWAMVAATVLLQSYSPSSSQHQRGVGDVDTLRLLLPLLVAWALTHHHATRTFAQAVVYKVLTRLIPESKDESIAHACLRGMLDYLTLSKATTQMRGHVEEYMDAFDAIHHDMASPRRVLCVLGGEPDPGRPEEMPELPFECAPLAIIDRIQRALKKEDKEEVGEGESEGEGEDHVGVDNYQKKFRGGDLAFVPVDDVEDGLFYAAVERANARHLAQSARDVRQDIIVVASLIDRIPNLAGLARTCEVFKAAKLVVGDLRALRDRQFQLISVTAEKWVPMEEVSESDLKSYLLSKKRNGYALVGLEQTSNSVPLHDASFPARCVLLLGREKEGIPPEFIHALDMCVEIPQLGIIRSLNVHVSSSIAIWEYTKQHRFGGSNAGR